MSYLNSIPVNAGEDLSGAQYKAIEIDGTVAATNAVARGLLQNKPRSGEDATLGVSGRSRYVAGAAVANGANLMATTSGYLITVTSGNIACGFALGAVSSGGIGEAFVNFANNGVIVI